MSYDADVLNDIYDKTNGHCRYCGKKLAWNNYGALDEKASWEVDHGIPLSRGGSDDFRNLWPACTECNRQKGDMTTSEYRRFLKNEYGWQEESVRIIT
jgi:5-methylcytosine-specific restriction endonuclease McrA